MIFQGLGSVLFETPMPKSTMTARVVAIFRPYANSSQQNVPADWSVLIYSQGSNIDMATFLQPAAKQNVTFE